MLTPCPKCRRPVARIEHHGEFTRWTFTGAVPRIETAAPLWRVSHDDQGDDCYLPPSVARQLVPLAIYAQRRTA